MKKLKALFKRAARGAVLLGVAASAGFLARPAFAVDAGPGQWSTEQTWKQDNNHGGEFLKGYFYWPASQPTLNGKRALILTLHGCAQTAKDNVINSTADGGYNWKATADKYGAIVVAPNATGNVANFHCWDYYGANHTRTSGHVGVLLDVVNRFLTEPRYAIDPNQVYVTGLSSGGGETMVLGCVAPDIFAGLGAVAGPSVGTTVNQIGRVPPGYTATTEAQNCRNIAPGGNYFATQIISVAHGKPSNWSQSNRSDGLVSTDYSQFNVDAMKSIYGGSYTQLPDSSVPGGGTLKQWKNNNGKLRATLIEVAGMGHAWPAGPGGEHSTYVDDTRVNYPEYVADYFFKNNLRVALDPVPTVTACSATVAADKHTVTVSGAATDNGSITEYQVVLNGPTSVAEAAGSGPSFSKHYTTLADGFYSGTVTAKDNQTPPQPSAPCIIGSFVVGTPPPAPLAPANVTITSTTPNLISLSWSASNSATGYKVFRNGDKVTASPVAQTNYTDSGLAPSTTYSYTVSAIGPGGESPPSSSAVSGTTGPPPFACTASTASNYAHVQAGRAHDVGGVAFANGSNQRMGLDNLFATTTLAQTSAGYYVIGNCPAAGSPTVARAPQRRQARRRGNNR